MLDGPISEHTIITNRFLWFIFAFPLLVMRLIWIILYPFMKIFYLIVVNFGAILWVCFYILTIPLRLVWNTAGLAVRVPWWLVARTPMFRNRFPNAVATPFSGWITAWNMLTWPYRRYRKSQTTEVVAEMAPILEPATKILPVLETLESIPPPTQRIVSAESLSCWRKFCNLMARGRTTGRYDPRERLERAYFAREAAKLGFATPSPIINAKQFMGTRTFWIY